MADATLEHARRALHVGGLEAGEVHGGVEVAPGERTVEVVRLAVAPEARDAAPERIVEAPAIEQRHVVAAGEEAPDEVIADEARPPDDEDLQDAVPGPARGAARRARSAAGT